MGTPSDLLSRSPTDGNGPAHPREDDPLERRWHWVPIRSLAQRHRARILAHLLSLTEQDRYLRFGYAAGDAQVARYTDLIDFSQDEVFGIFNRRLELIAQAHLAALPGGEEAEFGVSVWPSARGRGYGSRLFDHAVLHARNRGIHTLIVHALSENTPMLRIARHAGAVVERDGTDSLARLRLPRDDLRSHVDEWVEHGAAEIDYQIKRHTRRVAGALHRLGDVSPPSGEAPPRADAG